MPRSQHPFTAGVRPPEEQSLQARRRLIGLAGLGSLAAVVSCTDFGDPIVPPPIPVGVVLITGPASKHVQVGDAVDFTAEARDPDGAVLPSAAITWSSSHAAVASVEGLGHATALAPGVTAIRAASGGVQSAPETLVVLPRVVTVAITSPAGPNPEVEVGLALQFAAEARDAGGAAIAGAPVVWSSSDSTIAGIDATGRAVGRAVGSSTLHATSYGVQSPPVQLQVRPATQVPATIAIVAPSSPASLLVGATVQFAAEVRDTHGDPIPDAAIDWKTSNPGVATIDAAGLARGTGAGSADITAGLGALQSAAVQLQVSLPPVASVRITGPPSPLVGVGQRLQLTAEARDAANDVIPGASFAWTSETDTVAVIDATGLAFGINPGTTNIRAASGGVQSPPVLLRVPPTYAMVERILIQRGCVGCHGWSYGNMVNVPIGRFMLVKPGDPEQSYIYIKIAACPGPDCSGSRMPAGGPPLPPEEIQTIHDWIAGGARLP